MRRGIGIGCLVCLLVAAVPAPAESPWAVPPEGSCAPSGGLRGWPIGEDAPPIPFQPGDAIQFEAAERLRNYLPPELWNHRDKFFFEGMRLEIGPCFRDYSAPAFYREAAATFRGEPTLTGKGGLENFTVGTPFLPDDIRADDPQAGLKWAWNVEHRYQGAGFRGKFRIVDMVGRSHRAEPFEGEIFKLLMNGRPDRPDEYKAPGAKSYHWVAGGLFFAPFNAREYAWRQFRDVSTMTSSRRTDDLHAYLPQWRRVRRITAVGVEGLYMPSFAVGVVPAQTLAVGGGASGGLGDAGGGLGSIGVGAVSGSVTPTRNGFEGLELRPLLWDYRVLGLQDVLAPINAVSPAYPEVKDRPFGSWGLSFASDRWDLRRALVIEARAKNLDSDAAADRVLHYVDLQTHQPLYYVSWDRRGELIDVGMYVGRWSEDREDYPAWPDDAERPIRVLDPVAAAFANVREDGGWRRENWDVVSTPPADKLAKRMVSVGQLTRRR